MNESESYRQELTRFLKPVHDLFLEYKRMDGQLSQAHLRDSLWPTTKGAPILHGVDVVLGR